MVWKKKNQIQFDEVLFFTVYYSVVFKFLN